MRGFWASGLLVCLLLVASAAVVLSPQSPLAKLHLRQPIVATAWLSLQTSLGRAGVTAKVAGATPASALLAPPGSTRTGSPTPVELPSDGSGDFEAARKRLRSWGVVRDEAMARALLPVGSTRSALYSIGRVKPVFGDVHQFGYDELGRNRTYKGELIVTIATHSGLWRAANMARNVLLLGFEHFVVLARTEENCRGVQAISPEVSCIWSTRWMGHPGMKRWNNDYIYSLTTLWMLRWHLIAGMARRGFSVLLMDSDISARTDFYAHLKHDPWRSYAIVSHLDGGDPGFNCGWTYVSGVRPGGGADWVLTEVTKRFESFLALPNPPKGPRGHTPPEALWEQFFWNDAGQSAFSGRQMFKGVPQEFLAGAAQAAASQAWRDGGYAGPVPRRTLQWRSSHVAACANCSGPGSNGGPGVTVTWHNLHVPSDAGDVAIWATPGGPLTSGPEGKPWSPRDAATAEPESDDDARAMAVDRIAAAPDWLVSAFHAHGMRGAFAAPPPARPVFSHLMGAPGHPSKQLAFRELGYWYFRPGQVQNEPYGPGMTPASRLVAADPRVTEPLVPSSRAFRALLHRLHLVGVLTARLPVTPRLPCRSPWLETSDDPGYLYNTPGGLLAPQAPRDQAHMVISGPAAAPRCNYVLTDACLVDLSLAELDLEMWLEAHPALAPPWWGVMKGEASGGGEDGGPATVDLSAAAAAGDASARVAAIRALMRAQNDTRVLFVRGLDAVPLITTTKAPEGGWPGSLDQPPSQDGLDALTPKEVKRLAVYDDRCRFAFTSRP